MSWGASPPTARVLVAVQATRSPAQAPISSPPCAADPPSDAARPGEGGIVTLNLLEHARFPTSYQSAEILLSMPGQIAWGDSTRADPKARPTSSGGVAPSKQARGKDTEPDLEVFGSSQAEVFQQLIRSPGDVLRVSPGGQDLPHAWACAVGEEREDDRQDPARRDEVGGIPVRTVAPRR